MPDSCVEMVNVCDSLRNFQVTETVTDIGQCHALTISFPVFVELSILTFLDKHLLIFFQLRNLSVSLAEINTGSVERKVSLKYIPFFFSMAFAPYSSQLSYRSHRQQLGYIFLDIILELFAKLSLSIAIGIYDKQMQK